MVIGIENGTETFHLLFDLLGRIHDLMADIDQTVVRLLQPLGLKKKLLIQLFTRPEPSVFDLDVNVRFEAGELDKVARQVRDLLFEGRRLPVVSLQLVQVDLPRGASILGGLSAKDPLSLFNDHPFASLLVNIIFSCLRAALCRQPVRLPCPDTDGYVSEAVFAELSHGVRQGGERSVSGLAV